MMQRRGFLGTVAAMLAARSGVAQSTDTAVAAEQNGTAPGPGLSLGDPVPFVPEDLVARAREMAGRDYAPRPTVPQEWIDLTYEQYKSMWFPDRHALWQGSDVPVRLDVFAPGLYFPSPVEISGVEDGQARPLVFDAAVFDRTDKMPDLPDGPTLGYSGLRLRSELETKGIFTEFAVFQGASYFRAIGTGETYGLSARGIAVDTAEPSGEEFPEFVAFWVERPEPGTGTYVIHALMDGPSVTGAYRFAITPGEITRMAVEATIFARNDVGHVGIAPLTSMFLFDETIRDRFSDFRPAVHDSDGLLMHTGAGEVLWRPMGNPRTLQVSAFGDDGPRGFGLMQRSRRFEDFADLELLYHRRPGVWIVPGEDWGPGAVTLVEIPTDREIFDNIVSYWRPRGGMDAGAEHRFTYTMDWADTEPATVEGLSHVTNTRIGGHPDGGMIVAIDFSPNDVTLADLDDVDSLIRASAGTTGPGIVQRNPETGGARVAFAFDPGDEAHAEMRVQLIGGGAALSEVWLYRWTA